MKYTFLAALWALLNGGIIVAFVWHAELYMDAGFYTLGNGWMTIPAIQMYHALMYLTFILTGISLAGLICLATHWEKTR